MDNHLYDEIDVRNARSVGYWQGAAAGVLGTIIMLGLIGLYLFR